MGHLRAVLPIRGIMGAWHQNVLDETLVAAGLLLVLRPEHALFPLYPAINGRRALAVLRRVVCHLLNQITEEWACLDREQRRARLAQVCRGSAYRRPAEHFAHG